MLTPLKSQFLRNKDPHSGCCRRKTMHGRFGFARWSSNNLVNEVINHSVLYQNVATLNSFSSIVLAASGILLLHLYDVFILIYDFICI